MLCLPGWLVGSVYSGGDGGSVADALLSAPACVTDDGSMDRFVSMYMQPRPRCRPCPLRAEALQRVRPALRVRTYGLLPSTPYSIDVSINMSGDTAGVVHGRVLAALGAMDAHFVIILHMSTNYIHHLTRRHTRRLQRACPRRPPPSGLSGQTAKVNSRV